MGLFKQYIIKPVQDTWNLVKEKFSDLSNWMLGIWAKIKGYTLEAWKMVYTYIVEPVISAYNSAKRNSMICTIQHGKNLILLRMQLKKI